MSGAQRPKVIRHPIQVVAIWRVLIARVVGLHGRAAAHTRGQWGRHVVGEIEALERELDSCLDLVCEWALRGEALEMNEKHRRES